MTRVLIADADPSILRMLSLMLGLNGAEVRTATDGLAALDALEREPPDALLLDPDVVIGPIAVFLHEVRARTPATRVIVTSGEIGGEPHRIGADAFIRRPFRPHALLDALEQSQAAPGARAAAGADSGLLQPDSDGPEVAHPSLLRRLQVRFRWPVRTRRAAGGVG